MPKKNEELSTGQMIAEEISEKELLKQAEEREKERKEQEEAEKEAEKEEAKEKKAEERAEKLLKKVRQVRVRPRHGKKYRAIEEKIEKNKEYALAEAIDLVLESSTVKFDATVEMHVKLNAKEKNIRGMVVLPGGMVKEKKILEVLPTNADEVIENIKAGKIDFDLLIVDIKVMPKFAQLAKVLGPKGLMPSPKAGTVVADVAAAALELKAGKVEYRADKLNIVHMSLGRVSFGSEKIKLNYDAIISHLPKRIDSIYLTTSMGPSIKVSKKN
ncbi:MAG: 50S ribosomal protein L1 [bacterium]